MYVIQARDLINGTCGSPILAPSIEIAKRQIGRMISENPILKDSPDGATLDVICEWDPGDGILDNFGKPSKCFRVFSGSECLAAYQHAFDAINSPGEGEWSGDDGEEDAK
jgi:hypothetical protein